MRLAWSLAWLVVPAAVLAAPAPPKSAGQALDLERFDEATARQVDGLIATWEPLIAERKAVGTLPLLTFDELYVPLTPEQHALCDALRAVSPESLQGSSRRLPPPRPDEVFDRLDGQVMRKVSSDGAVEVVTLDAQYLPRKTSQAYQRMMAAMRRDLGRRLLVESGYRSPAHQLYLFCFYLPKHGYSIRETNRFVALPGCSEHGSPSRQAIDFITETGINGEDHPEEFEALPEYAWLTQHAHKYGFVLSYPRGHPTTSFEPWHWHWENSRSKEAEKQRSKISEEGG